MSLTDKERSHVLLARDAFHSGKAGRLKDGKMAKAEPVEIGRKIEAARNEAERERRISSVVSNKPDNYFILRDDSELAGFIGRIREEVGLQREQWAGRLEMLGVESMTAGDFEGTGIDSYADLSIGFSIWLPILGEGYYLPYGHVDMRGEEGFEFLTEDSAHKSTDAQLTRSKVLAAITPYLSAPTQGKTFHMGAARYDLHVANNDGYTIKGCVWDTLDAMHTLNEHEEGYGLKPITQKYAKAIGIKGDVFTFEDLFGNRSPAPFNTEVVGIYAIKDVYFGWSVFEWQFEIMKRTGRLIDCYAKVDSKLPETDVFMERCGFVIDLEEAARLERKYSEAEAEARRKVLEAYSIDDAFIRKMDRTIRANKIEKWVETQANRIKAKKAQIQKKADKIAEMEFTNKTHTKSYANEIAMRDRYEEQLREMPEANEENAPQEITTFEVTNNNHIGYLIYDHLKIEDKTGVVNRGKKRGTSVDVMEIYFEDEPALAPLAEVSMYQKLLGTYLRPMLGIDAECSLESDGRLHSNFKAGGTSTGRYSSSKYTGRPSDILAKFKEGARG